MARVLILGANGQLAWYVAASARQRGHAVIGFGRAPTGPEMMQYRQVDLMDSAAFEIALEETAPDKIFHLAAIHGAAGTREIGDQWRAMHAVHVEATRIILEHMRRRPTETLLIYASSAKVFGDRITGLVDEARPFRPDCLYGLTKATACGFIDYYRRRYGVLASAVHLFNAESIRRPKEYFMPKVAAALAAARHGAVSSVHTLNFHGNWGSAAEYMDVLVRLAETRPEQDFVLGNGESVYARDLVNRVFAAEGLDRQLFLTETAGGDSARGQGFKVSTARLAAAVDFGTFSAPDRVLLDIANA